MRTTGREDERRRREEVLATSLQQQVDELRHLLREQATRQQRQDEQVRQMEAQLAQVRLDLGEARQETSRLAQLRQIEDQRVRQILTEVQQRVDEPVRPLRNLQAQLTDLTDQVRAHREQTAQEGRQIEAVAGRLDAVRGDALRALEMHRQTREIFDSLQQTQANHARDIQKVSDQAKVIEQETRRRAAGVEQRLENLSLRIDEVGSYRPQLEESLRAVREDIRAFQPQIDAQTQRLKQHEAHLARVQAQAEERDTIMRERTEDVRTALASEIGGVTTALNEAIAAVYARLGEWEEAQREVGGRVSEVAVEAAGLREMQARLGEALLRSEERLVRLNLELAQGAWEALMARRQRESEG